jgi:protein-disulfide isomerase
MNNTSDYTSNTAITTETKVAIGILIVTIVIIVGGLSFFKGSSVKNADGTLKEETVMKNIDLGLTLSAEKVSPSANPKITGTTATTKSTSTTPILVTEFMDYECPACAVQGEALVQKLLETYGSRVTITRRIFPVHGAPAIEIGRMVLASQDVSKDAYLKLHTKVLETQDTWARLGTAERVGFFKNMTKEMDLNYESLVAVGKSKYASQIDTDKADALDLGIRATPSFIINNSIRITGGVPFQYFERYIDAL